MPNTSHSHTAEQVIAALARETRCPIEGAAVLSHLAGILARQAGISIEIVLESVRQSYGLAEDVIGDPAEAALQTEALLARLRQGADPSDPTGRREPAHKE